MSTDIATIAAQVPSSAAQYAVAKIMAALGSQSRWNFETLDSVAEAVRPVMKDMEGLVPSVFDESPSAVEFWEAVNSR
jgi:hypothetical protein